MSLKKITRCSMIIIIAYAIIGESMICDKCTCKPFIINCTETGLVYILDLWDHSEVLENAVLMHFDYNDIEHVKQLPPSKVKYLSLQHNKIKQIDDAAFKHLNYLVELDLSYNCLTTDRLNANIFKTEQDESSSKLVHLSLDYNNLHSLSRDIFKELNNLASLTLAGNPLVVIDQSTMFALHLLPMLKVLNLSNTSLNELPDYLLHTPRFLETLNLSKNEFKQIPQTLSEAYSLKRLDFSYNPIKSILHFPNVQSLKTLHLSHMPELNTIGPRAFSLLNNLEEFHCTHNQKLKSIDPLAFSYKLNNESEYELWPSIVKLDLSYNALEHLDRHLLGRWDTLDQLNLQGNKWICDCVNQWLVSTLAPMAEARHPEFLKDLTCQQPIEMSGISILDLDHRHYHMRCLDYYNNRPEKDGILLVGILIGVILAVPFTMGFMMCYTKKKSSFSYYHRIFNNNKGGVFPHDYQLRETSVYQPTSIIADGY